MMIAVLTPMGRWEKGLKSKTLTLRIDQRTALLMESTAGQTVLAFARAEGLRRGRPLKTTLLVLEQRQTLGIGFEHPITAHLKESVLLRGRELGTLV